VSKFVIHRNQKNWLHPFDFQYRDGSYVLNLTMDITSLLNRLLCLKKRFILVPFVFIGLLQQTTETFGQASPLPNPTYQSPDQRSIVVTFNQAITGSATASDWSVTLGGTPVGIQSVSRISATTVRVLFTPSTVNGVGVNYILPGQLVQISFTNISGSLTTVVGGAPVNGTGGAITAVNNYIPSCADIEFLNKGFVLGSTNDICAPVNMNFFRWVYEVSLVYRNSSAYAGNVFFGSVAWGDGFTTNTNSAPSDDNGVANPNFFLASGTKLSTQPVAYATIRPTHTYPATYSLPAPASCEFIANLTPFFSGLGSCGSKIDQTLFPSYDTDNKNTGALNLPEFVPGSKLVCLGNNVGMMFNDATNLNCRVAVEANAANDLTRNIRIIYGSQNYAGGNIPNVFVTLPASLGGATVQITDAFGALIAPNYFPTSGSADFNGVINLPASVTAPSGTAFMGTIFTTSPAGQAVGQRLYVKLEYWNICNQYDGIAVTGNQEFVENFIEIITKPSTPVSVDKNFCQTENMSTSSPVGPAVPGACTTCFEVTSGSVAGATQIKWFTTLADANADASAIVNDYGTNSRFLRPTETITRASGGTGPIPDAGPAAGDTYSVWVRYTTSVNACLSDPVEVKIVKREQLTTPSSITSGAGASGFTICAGVNGIAFTAAPVTGSNPLGGDWNYTWSLTGAGITINPAGPTGQNMTLDIASVATGAKTVNALRKYTTLTTDLKNCASTNQTFPFTANFVPIPGTTSGGTSPICLGSNIGTITLAGSSGTRAWQVSTTGALGPFSDIAPAQTGTTLSVTPAASGTYHYRVRVSNGVCSDVFSTVSSPILVRETLPTPTAFTTGLFSFPICSFTNGVTFNTTPATGSNPIGGAWNYTWGTTGGGLTINPVTTSANMTLDIAVAASGAKSVTAFASYATAPACPSATRTFNFTVDLRPVGGSITGGMSPICLGSSTGTGGSIMTLTGFTGSIIQWEVDSGSGFTAIPATAGLTTFSEIPATDGTYTYRVRVNNGTSCAPVTSAIRTIIVREALPAPGAITSTSTFPLCAGVNGVAFSSASPAPGSNPLGGDWNYTWGTTGGGLTINPANPTTAAMTLDIPTGISGAKTATIFTKYDTNDAYGSACPSPTTSVAFNVNRITAVLSAAPTTICPSASSNLTFTITGGVGPYEVVYFNGTGNTTLTGYVSGTPITTGSLASNTTFSIVSVKDANNCFSVSNTGTPTITVGSLMTAATLSGGTTSCVGSSVNLTLVIIGGVSPFQVTIPGINAGLPFAYTSGNPIAVPTTTAGTTNYTASGILDACGNNFPIASVVGNPQAVILNPTPVIFNRVASVCSGSPFSIPIVDGVPAASTIVPVGTTYAWGAPVITGGITGGSAQTGQATVGQTLTNPTNAVQTATYTVTPTSGTCVGATFQVVVTVNPTPVIFNRVATVCSGAAFSIPIANGVPLATTIVPAGITYDWGAPVVTGGLTGGSAQTSQASVTQTLTNPTNVAQTATYTVTPTAGLCTGATFQVTVTVNPTPAIFDRVATICSGSPFSIPIANGIPAASTIVPAGTTYAWGAPVVSGGITGGSAQAGQASVGQTLTNPTNSVQTATYTVTPTSGICVGPTFQVTVTVNPTPVILNRVATVCSGSPFSIPIANGVPLATTIVPAGITYDWGAPVVTGGVTGGSAQTGQTSISQTLVNPTNTARTATYTVTPTSGICTGATFQVVVTVNPTPAIFDRVATVCSGSPFSIPIVNGVPAASTIVPAGTTYAWGAPVVSGGITGGSAQAGQATVSQTLTNPTNIVQTATYTVTPTSGTCVGATFQVTVTVNPRPVLFTYTPAAICSGGTFSVLPTDGVPLATTIVPALTTYSWPAPVVTGGITGGSAQSAQASISQTLSNPTAVNQTATYTVTPTSGASGLCVGSTFQVIVTVNPLPIVTSITPSVCSDAPGGTQAVQNLTTRNTSISAGAGVTTTVTWWLDPATTATPILPGGAPGQDQAYTVNNGDVLYARVVTNATSCVSIASATFTVKPQPFNNEIRDGTGVTIATVLTTGAVYNLCASGSSILFQTNGALNAGSTFSWNVPPTSYANEFNLITASANIIVFTFPNVTQGNPLSLYSTTGIPLTVTETLNGCAGNPIQIFVKILATPPADVITGPTSVCSGGTAIYSVPFTGGSTYSWVLPNLATITSLPATSNTITVQMSTFSGNVTVQSSNGICTSTAAAPLFVNIVPRPSFTRVVNPVCSGQNINSQVTLSPSFPGSTFNWEILSISGTLSGVNVGDVAIGVSDINQTPVNVSGVPASISYRVTPIGPAPDLCAGTPVTFAVTVNPEPVLNLSNKVLCSKQIAQYEIKLTPTNLPTGTLFSWGAPVMSDLSSQGTSGTLIPMGVAGTIHINDAFTNLTALPITATYTITAVSGTGCNGSQPLASRQVVFTINPEPLGVNSSQPICSNGSFSINPQTNNLAGGNNVTSSFTWTAAYGAVTGGVGSGSIPVGGSLSETLRNVTSAPIIVVYTIFPTSQSGGCSGSPAQSFTHSVTVNPEPVGADVTRVAQCSGVAFSVSAVNITNGLGGSSSYTWARNTLPAGLTQILGGTSSNVIAETLQNLTSGPLSATYVVTATAGICAGSTYVVTVPINPEPVAINTIQSAICSGSAFAAINPQSNNISVFGGNSVTSSFTWSAAYGGVTGGVTPAPIIPGGTLPSETLVNTTGALVNVVYTLVPTAVTGSCAAISTPNFTITVPVNPEPVMTSLNSESICSGSVPTLNFTSDPLGSTFNWEVMSKSASVSGATVGNTGTGNLNQALTNTSGAIGTVTYRVRGTGLAPSLCVGAYQNVVITVEPQPIIVVGQAKTICSGSAVNYHVNLLPAGLPANTRFSWPDPDGAGPATAGTNVNESALNTITDVLTNTTGANITVTYNITPTVNSGLNCTTLPAVPVTITVEPQPIIVAGQAKTICSGSAVNYHVNLLPAGLPANTRFSWPDPDGAGPATAGTNVPESALNTITDVLTNVTGSNLTVTYQITPTVNGGLNCSTIPAVPVTITVQSEPVGTPANLFACSDEAFSYNIQATSIDAGGNGVLSKFTFVVSSSDETNVPTPPLLDRTIATSAGLTGSFTNTTSGIVLITYRITPTNAIGLGCPGSPFDVVYSIRPEPKGPATTTEGRCSGETNNFNLQTLVIDNVVDGNSVPSKFKYTVSSSNPIVTFPGANRTTATVANITDTYVNKSNVPVTITYTVTPVSLTVEECEGTPFDFKIVLHPEPVGSNVVDPACSSSLNHSIQSQITNGVSSVFTYTVSSSDPVGVPPAPNRVVSSNAPITDNYSNLTGSPVTVTYTITPFSASPNNCQGSPFTYAVNISPKPQAGPFTEPAVCSNIPFTLDPQDVVNNNTTTPPGNSVISTFTWTRSLLTTGLVVKTAGTGTGTIAETILNRTSGNSILNAVYTVTPTAGSCVGSPFDITVPINPEPVVSNFLNDPACSDKATGMVLNTNGVSVGAASYNILSITPSTGLVPAPGNVVAANGVAANYAAGDVFTNTGAVPLTVTYKVVPVSSGPGGCSGESKDVVVTINPEPVIEPQVILPICKTNVNNPPKTNVVLGGDGVSVAALNYRISVPKQYSIDGGFSFAPGVPAGFTDTGNVTVGAPGDRNLIRDDKYINTSATQVIVRYTIVAQGPAASGSCFGDPVIFDVPVNPEPILDPALSPASICSGLTSNVTLSVAPGSVGAAAFNVNAISFGSLVRGPSNSVTGNNQPASAIFNDTYVNTDPSGNPLLVTYTIAPVSAVGCIGAEGTITLTIDPAPNLSTGLGGVVCSNSASGITFSTTGAVAAANYNITNVSIDLPLTQTAGNTGARNGVTSTEIVSDRFENLTNGVLNVTYRVQPVAGGIGCKGPEVDILLRVEPSVTMIPIPPSIICSYSTASPVTTSIALNSNTLPSAGQITFNVNATSPGNVISVIRDRNNLPATSAVPPVVLPIEDQLVNNTNAPVKVTYAITPVAAGAAGGAGCRQSIPTIVEVSVQPKPKLVVSPSTQEVCSGVKSTMKLTTPTTPTASIQFIKSFSATGGSGMTLTNAGTNYTSGQEIGDIWQNTTNTIQTVTYTFSTQGAGCFGDEVTVLLKVKPTPTATASVPNLAICSFGTVDIDLIPDPGPDLNTSTIFNYEVSAPSQITGARSGVGDKIFQILRYVSPTPTVENSDVPVTVNYVITPKANNCTGPSINVPVVVNPKPNLLRIPSRIDVCNATSPIPNLNIKLESNVVGAIYSWTLDSPPPSGVNGVVEQPVAGPASGINQVLTNTTGVQVSLTYTIKAFGPGATACESDDKIVVVTIAPEIRAEFRNSDVLICRGSSEFLNVDISGQAPFTIVYSENGVNQPPITGAANIKVIKVTPSITTTYRIESVTGAFNNCAPTFIGNPVTVSVAQLPVVSFNEGTVPDFNGATTVTYTNTSTPLDFSQFRYDWTFGIAGDATPVTLAQSAPGGIPVVYSSPGTKRVTLSATNKAAETAGVDCKTSDVFRNITINVVPLVASFEVNPKELCFPGTIKVTNVKTGAGNFPLIYKWEVLLGSKTVLTSGIRDIGEFTVTTPGTYLIRFQVEEPATGQVKIATPIQVIVYDKPLATFDLRPDIVYVPDTEMLTFNFSNGANQYLWDFGDGGTSTDFEPKYTYAIEGKYDVTLIARFDHGNGIVCSDTLTRTIIAKQGGLAKIPNSFTPNPNGRSSTGTGGNGTFNDVFLPLIKGISNDSDAYNLQIYDRWGNLIFESTSSVVGWDGYNKDGKLMPAGVYVYKLTVRFSDSQRTTTVGDITMLY